MTMNHGDPNTRHDGEAPIAPAKLVAALKEPPSRRVFVPPAIDQAILTAAQRHLARPEGAGFNFFRSWLVWPAVATACIALLGLICLVSKPGGSSARFAREDLNHDGRVDILDAFQLAREVRSGTTLPSDLDLNRDGVVDGRDASLIANDAVKLEKGGRS
jgi:hypothetical protein